MTVAITAACGSGTGNPDQLDIKVSGITVLDYGNNADASDIRISFSKPEDIMAIGNFRIFIVKSSSMASFDLATSLALMDDHYQVLPSSTTGQEIDLSASLNDSDGDPVTEGVPYKIVVLSIAAQVDNQESQLSDFSAEFRLERKNVVKTLAANVDGGSGGMAIDADGNVYMADFGQTLGGPAGTGDKVFRITPDGSVSIFATGFVGASGNDFDSQGNLFQSNIRGQSISKVTPDGTVSIFASGPPISGTVGISIDDNDVLFVADCTGNQLLRIDTEGNVSVYSDDTLFNCPNGITRDESDNLYVANFSDDRILKITPQKEVSVLTTLPRGVTASGNNGHITYHNGFLYAVARAANQIYKISLDGENELFAGSGTRGSKDGSALTATFSIPNDLIFSNDGTKLYINDVVPTSGGINTITPCNIRVIEIVE